MKKFLASLLTMAVVGCGTASGDFVVTQNDSQPLPTAVAAVFNKPLYQGAVWGLRVVDLTTNQVVIDYNSSRQFFVGSVRKLFSVGLLLNQIGPDHTYDTPVYRQGTVDNAGVLSGDLVLVASGDLTMGGRANPDGSLAVTDYDHNEANSLGQAVLSTPDPLAGYKSLAKQVAAAGITRVTGDVVVDDRLFQPFNFRDEFDLKPIFVNDDLVDVSITPSTPGNPAQVVTRPVSAALTVVNNLQTGAAGSASTLELTPELPPNIGTPGATATVQGSVPSDLVPPLTNTLPLVQTFRITNPSNYARTVFVEALEAEGVVVDADTVKQNPVALLPGKDTYQTADRVALLVGDRYSQLARYILKVSYNIGADTSELLLGLTQGVDNMTAALGKESEILSRDYGISPDSYTFVDGSGGGPTTADNVAVTDILTKLLQKPTSQALFNALPVLAVDGSLGFVNQFESDSTLAGAKGQVHAKTGTFAEGSANGILLKGQAFAGYIDARSGHRLAYQVVVNNVPLDSVPALIEVFQDEGTVSAILWRDY